MRRILIWTFLLLLLLPGAGRAQDTYAVPEINSLYGTYAFHRQVYMNPLSSFLALDGFAEYYVLEKDSLTIVSEDGSRRTMAVAWQAAPMDAAAFEGDFMMAFPSVPDVSGYKEKHQYTGTGVFSEDTYRLYLLDETMWLARIHKDSANTQKQEYIWSIYEITPLEEGLPGTIPQ